MSTKEENKTADNIHSFQCKADHQPLKQNLIYTYHTFFILKVQKVSNGFFIVLSDGYMVL